MIFPSLQRIADEAERVLRRFPLTLLCSFVLGGVGMFVIHLDAERAEQLTWTFPVLSAAGMGLSLTLALSLAAERYRWPSSLRWATQIGAVVLLVTWALLAPPRPDSVWGIRLLLLLLGLHLMVAAGPYLAELRRKADTPGFWRYNETLFLRILSAMLYSGVLYAGCALALLAVEKLFDVNLGHHVYLDLLLLLGTVFNTWFFLAGVPHDFAALEEEAAYPKGLKLFTQFVLLPLVVLYLAILYAYLARILLAMKLPQGWVSTLVLALSVAGIFALLLIHPIRQTAENAWIRTFARWFYRALFPLLALLAVAISTRISSYGITEERYFVLVLAAWLFGMAVYFLRHSGQGIIWIPASLAVVAFLAAGGPWGAFAVAERSQFNQLVALSRQYRLLSAGHLDDAGQRVPNLPLEARVRITSIFEFFADRYVAQHLQPLFAANVALPDSLTNTISLSTRYARSLWQADRLFTLSSLKRTNSNSDMMEDESSISFLARSSSTRTLGNGQYWFNEIGVNAYNPQASKVLAEANLQEGNFRFRTQAHARQLLLEQLRADGSWQPQLTLFPGAVADSLARIPSGRTQDLPTEALTLHRTAGRITVHVFMQNVSRYQQHDSIRYAYNAQALLELKK
ncbi:hypothetical protein GCM10022409_01010 [Hymenobacter glaciei]|uniref:DUF4153 domain-containing protein n=1 Tax=Hymenobacter glaciei TaxID=877209 RepID=A0ABP7T525_9BACT